MLHLAELSLATYPVRIVKIDSVPVLQVGCRAESDVELRRRGGTKDLLVNFNTTDSRFDFHLPKYHPDHCRK